MLRGEQQPTFRDTQAVQQAGVSVNVFLWVQRKSRAVSAAVLENRDILQSSSNDIQNNSFKKS